jgi:membrane protease YdiL (CAAX protease family)
MPPRKVAAPTPLVPGLDARLPRNVGPVAALAIGVLVTAIALPESWRGWPYAPFPLLHASLAIALPLALGFGSGRRPGPEIRTWLPREGRPLLAAVLFIGGFVVSYVVILHVLGKTGSPRWDLITAYRGLMKLYVARYGKLAVVVFGYLFLGVWPMFGEELFYRGFLFRALAARISPLWADVITSTLFGLRHAAQLAYLAPAYPVPAAVAYFVWAFGVSALWCWTYQRTGSLWLCIATHGINLILAPIALIALVR